MAGARDSRDWLRRRGNGARALIAGDLRTVRQSAGHFHMGVVKPDCLHGTLLGPWKDPDGNDRYACLWEPYPAASKRRLPHGDLSASVAVWPKDRGANRAAP